MITLGDIIRAQHRLKGLLDYTPLEAAPDLGENIYLKLENANKTHSFKIRGALNAVLSLDETARQKGIVAASSGNHAQAVAFASHLTHAKAQILMPKHTPMKKVKGVKRYGAEAILFGETYDEAEAEGLRRGRDNGLTWVSPYNDPHVIAGAGTIGAEIIEQLPDIERVIVCVSGGGLIAGISTAIKELNPKVEVIGVNAESAPAMYNVFYNTDKPQVWETLAEALSGEIEDGSMTVPISQKYVDDIVLVSEEQIANAMRWMIDVQGWVVEGGGAVGVASLLHDVLPRDGRVTAVVVSGSNIDGKTLRRVLSES